METPFTAVIPPTPPRHRLVFSRGEGCWLEDQQDRRFLDFIQGWAVNTLGHSPKVIVDAITQQSEQLLNPGPAFYSGPMLHLARLLTQHSALDQVFFTHNGAEANDGAIRMARKWGALHKDGAYAFITMDNGFHDRILTAMSACGKPQWASQYAPEQPGVIKVPYHDIAAADAAIDDNTVAVMLELLQGESGVEPAQRAYVQQLRELTRERDCLLIVDEIRSGIGRTGTLFAHEQYGIEPDIITLGKGLGGGVPLAALITRSEYSRSGAHSQGDSFDGNPVMCAAGVAVLEAVAKKSFLQRVQDNGDYMLSRLQQLSALNGLGEARGHGLLLALETGALSASAIAEAAFTKRLLISAPRPDILHFMPPLNVTRSEIDEMCTRLQAAIIQAQQGHHLAAMLQPC